MDAIQSGYSNIPLGYFVKHMFTPRPIQSRKLNSFDQPVFKLVWLVWHRTNVPSITLQGA